MAFRVDSSFSDLEYKVAILGIPTKLSLTGFFSGFDAIKIVIMPKFNTHPGQGSLLAMLVGGSL